MALSRACSEVDRLIDALDHRLGRLEAARSAADREIVRVEAERAEAQRLRSELVTLRDMGRA